MNEDEDVVDWNILRIGGEGVNNRSQNLCNSADWLSVY